MVNEAYGAGLDGEDGPFGDESARRVGRHSRFALSVGDIMSETVTTIGPDAAVVEAAKAMSDNNISCIVVCEGDRIAGIVTETDLLRRAPGSGRDFRRMLVREIMTADVQTIDVQTSALEAGLLMEQQHVRRFPVLEESRLAGIITQTDLVRVLTSFGMWKDVGSIMTRRVATVDSDVSVAEAARCMAERDISCIVALDGDEVAGIFTERDFLKRIVALSRNPEKIKLRSVMSAPVTTVTPDYSVFSASKLMDKKKIRRVVVLNGDRLVGLITQTDIFNAIKGKLQEQEEKNLRQLEDSPNPVYMVDLEGITTYVNPAFLKLLEIADPEDVVGKPLLPESFWQDPSDRAKILENTLEPTLEIQELGLLSARGRSVYVTLFSNCLRNYTQQVCGSRGVLYDITEKKELSALREMERKLRRQEGLLRATLEATADGILVVNESGRISHYNQRFAEIWGIPQSLMDAGCDLIFAHLIEQMVDPDRFREHGDEDPPAGNLDTLVLKSGKTLERFCSPLEQNGHIMGRVWSYRDVTRRKQVEEALRDARRRAVESRKFTEQINQQLADAIEKANVMAHEALSASQTKSEFLANMSHEIRTPMNSIIGFGDLLREDNLSETQRKYVENICRSGEHLLEIINDILDFSKIEAGKLTAEKTAFSTSEFLSGLRTLIEPQVRSNGLEFQLCSGPDVPETACSDPARLRQCLLNLLSNAVKFTEVGHVFLHVDVQTGQDGGAILRFAVEDTGIGIAAEKQSVIFEPFIQADNGTTREFGGTGLGLAITRQLAALLGGDLTLRSEPGVGSTFTLCIPLPPVEEQTQQSGARVLGRSPLDVSCGPARVLIAEDNPTNQLLIETVLQRMGFTTRLVSDGEQAVREAASETYDLILMDIQMPRLNGLEAARELRRRGLRTPIVALTAHAMRGDDRKCLEAGCDAYLTKPLDRDQLAQVLSQVLPQSPQASASPSAG